jgi:hypothetical protein
MPYLLNYLTKNQVSTFLPSAFKYISLFLFTFVIAMAMLQPIDDNQQAKQLVNDANCMAKSLTLNQPVTDLQQLIVDENSPNKTTSQEPMASSCQTMNLFLAALQHTALPTLSVIGQASSPPSVQYSFLEDNRISHPPRSLS